MKNKTILVLGSLIFLFIMSSVSLKADEMFDLQQIDQGIIHVKGLTGQGKKVKLMIEKDEKKYTYNIREKKEKETFPLQLGNGKYKVSLLENVEGNKYRLMSSQEVEVKVSDYKIVYLNAIQNIDWDVSSLPVKKAVELTKNIPDLEKKAEVLYHYMINQYTYDYKKLATLSTTYLPVINETYVDKKGICYDFSSLYAAMLRSQGIPAKLIKGYTQNAKGYHAWNEAYDFNKKEWIIIDATYDLQVIKNNPKVKMIKKTKEYQKVNEY